MLLRTRGLEEAVYAGFLLASGLAAWYLAPKTSLPVFLPPPAHQARGVTVAVVLLLGAVVPVLYRLVNRWRQRRLLEGMTDTSSAELSEDETVRREVEQQRRNLKEGLQALEQQSANGEEDGRLRRDRVYRNPWYLMIGVSASGKSTVLENAGPLKFKTHGGVGGTLDCRWLLSKDAVLLDTAGRYSGGKERANKDHRAWLGFLKLLVRTRPLQPVNGIIVAIAVDDLVGEKADEAERTMQADAIRARLVELYQQFSCRLPVYVMFTKIDLLRGFQEYFDDFDRDDRLQVWGATLPLPSGRDGPDLSHLAHEYDLLVDRLYQRLPRLLGARPGADPARILDFPAHFASLRGVCTSFLENLFDPGKSDSPLLLRGFYFSSGIQDHRQIDLMTDRAAAIHYQAGLTNVFPGQALRQGLTRILELQPAVERKGSKGLSYFIVDLVKDVLIGEAGLVGISTRAWRRHRWRMRLAWMLAAVILLGGLAGLGISFQQNRAMLADNAVQLDRFERTLADLLQEKPAPRVTDLLPLLDTMGDRVAAADGPVPVWQRFGLSRHQDVATAARNMYERTLQVHMLPALLRTLEDQLRRDLSPAQRFEGLAAYMMLGMPDQRDPVQLLAVLPAILPPFAPNGQAAAMQHLESLITASPTAAAAPWLDGNLVGITQDLLSSMSLPAIGYQRLEWMLKAKHLPVSTLSSMAGPNAAVFVRRSGGAGPGDGVPGHFTPEAFRDHVLPGIALVARQLGRQGWILDPAGAPASPVPDTVLAQHILGEYESRYRAEWDGLLDDVRLAPMEDQARASQVLGHLTAGDAGSPLQALMDVIVFRTRPAAFLEQQGAGGGGATPAMPVLPAGGTMPGRAIDRHFQPLHAFVTGTGGGRSLSQLLEAMREVRSQISHHDAGVPVDPAVIRRLNNAVDDRSPLVRAVASDIGRVASSAVVAGQRDALVQAWAQVRDLCRAVDGRYPFSRDAPREISGADFDALFAPGGLIPDFFDKHLRAHVDRGQATWVWRPANGVDLGLSPDVLRQFERADAISRSWFQNRGSRRNISFNLRLVSVSGGIQSTRLQVGAAAHVFNQVPSDNERVTWPPDGDLRVELTAAPYGRLSVPAGDWSLFRLLDQAAWSTGGNGTYLLEFRLDGGVVRYQLDPLHLTHPFDRREVEGFSCPVIQ
ncbi:type VI secretion system membrane subunit TssM [Niveispirillum fermenti]